MALTDYQQRVVNERDELNPKLQALKVFVQGSTFLTVDKAEQDRLTRQVWAMGLYLNVLNERIAAFT